MGLKIKKNANHQPSHVLLRKYEVSLFHLTRSRKAQMLMVCDKIRAITRGSNYILSKVKGAYRRLHIRL